MKSDTESALNILQPPDSQVELFQALLSDAALGRTGSVLFNPRDGSSTMDYVKVVPLSDSSNRITHLMLVLFEISCDDQQQSAG
jgi:hypothetical protein